MAINQENMQKGFQSLSTRYGGGLLQEKQLLNQQEVVVFIGLGGLGGRTVNAIKAAATEKLDNPDRRFYLVVDTCTSDMDDISAVTKGDIEGKEDEELRVRGCIEEHEKISLFKDAFKIKTLGHDIDSWLNRAQLGEVEVDHRGAQGIRQIGRLMLMANGNYEIVYKKLFDILGKARDVAENKNVDMKIYIVAGISGGTGSGTVVDFTYMVKRAISGFAPRYKKIDAILFTPDVQFNDHGIDLNKRKGLKANFYAAIKEVDFFFNNKARGVSYRCPYTSNEAAYEEDIFDSCTIISRRAQGIDAAANSNGIIKKVADAITFEISGIKGKTNQGDGQSYSAFFSNVYNNFQLWWPTNSNGNGLDMPDWAPSRYSSLAYSSFYVPRDELIAYCANRLMERLAEHWKQSDATEDDLKNFFRKHHLGSHRAFAGTLFDISDCAEFFDADKSELPVDGFGPAKVKNCGSYLGLMQDVALTEGSTQRAIANLRKAERKMDATFIAPIVADVDKAFVDAKRGPVYAINLLSAGISKGVYSEKSGILAWVRCLVAELPVEVQSWAAELDQVYSSLKTKADKYDGQLSIDAKDLEAFTNECREFGENLLKCRLLANATDYLVEIFNKLNDKNERVFQIYTYAFEYLVDTLKKDSAYVTDTNRRREGQATIFSFDLTDFDENEKNSQRFKLFFESVVDTKNIDQESQNFVNMIFGGLKNLLDPATGGDAGVVQPQDVIEIIRGYFKTSFADFTQDVIEKFCVVAYSDVEATAERITEIWSNPAYKAAALKKAADAISAKIINNRNIMISCADISRDVQNFCSYETFAALVDTPNINADLGNPFILQANWSEFIGFKRIFGFPLTFLADLDDYKKEYDAQAITAGIHLDEMYSEDDGFGDWRYSLPEPYSYKTARFLKKYTEGGKDTTEQDKIYMTTLLELAKKAKALGILTEKTNGNEAVDDGVNAGAGQTFYELTWKLIVDIGDIDAQRDAISNNLRNVVSSFIDQKKTLNFFEVLTEANYRPAEAVPIQWTFVRPEFNVMQNRTNFGDDVDFGNFIILLRSNPYWCVKLKKAVDVFGKLHEIFDGVIEEFAAKDRYSDTIIDFMKAIRVGRITPFYESDAFIGFKFKVTENAEDDIVFVNAGLDAFDKLFFMYHCFTEGYLNIDSGKLVSMKTLVERDFSIEKRVDASKVACDNVEWFIAEADKVIKDATYLAHYDYDTMKKNFAEKLKYSKYQYSLPETSKGREDVDAIIRNLKGFFTEVRDNLISNRQTPVQAPTQTPVQNFAQPPVQNFAQPPVQSFAQPPVQQAAGWNCPTCGLSNGAGINFCPGCGTKKPDTWICVHCGAQNNVGNFCGSCGKPKADQAAPAPAPADWFCTNCGTKNNAGVNFCPSCGTAKN